MGVPVEFDVTQTGTGTSDWLPLNRWSPALMRLWAEVSGTATFSVEGTTSNVLRGETPVTATIQALENFSGLSASTTSTQNVLYRALRINVASGTGSVRLQAQSEGEV